MKHIDIISTISELWQASNFQQQMEYVKAYQDDYNFPLPPMDTFNVDTDLLSKS